MSMTDELAEFLMKLIKAGINPIQDYWWYNTDRKLWVISKRDQSTELRLNIHDPKTRLCARCEENIALEEDAFCENCAKFEVPF